MTSEQALQYFLAGVTLGSIYAIVAVGYNIIYNATGIINFAQGEFVMVGAMTAVSLSKVVPLPVAVLLAVLATALLAALIEIVFIRWLKDPPVIRMIIITIGLSILIREAALHLWDEKVRALPFFTGSEISSVRVFGAYVSPQVFWVVGLCGLMVAGLHVFFRFTLAGRAMRACADNRAAAMLCGINTRNMVTLAFVMSGAMGALAGCAISPLTQTQYDCGAPLAIKGFAVAVFGGLGNSTAAVAAGLILGLLETFSIVALPLAYTDAVSVAVLLLVLFARPGGLFGRRETGLLREF